MAVIRSRARALGMALVLASVLVAATAAAAPTCPVLVLNGSGRHATSAATIYPNTNTLVSFTSEAWVYPGLIPFDHNTQVLLTDDAYDLLLQYVPGVTVRLVVRLYGQSGTILTFADNRFVNLNQWHHVAVSFDATAKQLFIVLDGNVGSPIAVNLNDFATFTSNFFVGSFPSSGGFNGNVDEVRVSDVARYTANFTPPASLVIDANTRAAYAFSEPPTATSFLDSSGNNFTLTAVSGALTGNGGSCVLPPAPTVASISPTSGGSAGGTSVTVMGTNFYGVGRLSLGGTAATNVVVSNATTITATTPAHAAGVVDVVVTNPDGQAATLAGAFTYIAPPPAVSSIVPSSGTSAGGTSVTIGGSGFANGATVMIGGVAATSVAVINAATITAKTGARAAGPASVTVTNPDAQSGTATNAYTYYTASFTDDPLAAGVNKIRAVHVTELRSRIAALRSAYLLAPYAWTDPSLGTGMPVRAVHITDLREALRQVYVAAVRPTPVYTDSTLTTGMPPRVAHIGEVRSAIAAIE